MKPPVASTLWLALGLATAGAPPDALAAGRATPADATDGSSDVMAGLDCPTQPTETARRYHMIADDVSAEAALARARTLAREAARADVCAQASDFTCEALLTQVVDEASRWISVGGDGHRACATVAVPRQVVERAAREGARVRDELDAMVAPLSPGQAYVEAPMWAGGCDTGAAGHALQVEFQQRLRRWGHTIEASPSAGSTRFSLSARPAADSAEVIITVRAAQGAEVKPVGELRFDARLFGLDAEAGQRCVAWESLGLPLGKRPGTGGSQLEARFDRAERSFCEGETAQLVTRSTSARGAAVQAEHFVISATHDGAAVLTLRETTDTLSVPVSFSRAEGSSQAIVAFSTPPGVAVGALHAAQPMCRIAEGLSAKLIPAGAAVAMFSYTVEPEGSGRCVEIDPKRAAARVQLRDLIANLPPCRTP